MRITIDTDICIGAGQCALTAPGVFTQDDDGFSALLPGREDGAGDPLVRRPPAPAPCRPSRSRTTEPPPSRTTRLTRAAPADTRHRGAPGTFRPPTCPYGIHPIRYRNIPCVTGSSSTPVSPGALETVTGFTLDCPHRHRRSRR